MNVEKFWNQAQLNIGSASNFWGNICLYTDLFRNTPMKSFVINSGTPVKSLANGTRGSNFKYITSNPLFGIS